MRVGTYNVHFFLGADRKRNSDRVLADLKRCHVDVICLQEVAPRRVRRAGSTVPHQLALLRDALGFDLCCANGCAILSRWPLRNATPQGLRFRATCAWVTPRGAHAPVRITCMHLNHVAEPRRLREFAEAVNAGVVGGPSPTLLCGDLNALTRDDYDDAGSGRQEFGVL